MSNNRQLQIDIEEELLITAKMNVNTLNIEEEEMFQRSQFDNKDDNLLMLKDTTLEIIPSNLKVLFENFQTETMNISDICFQLIYLVALETGFAELNVYMQSADEMYNSYVVTSFYNAQNVRYLAQFKPVMEHYTGSHNYSMQLRSIANEEHLEALELDRTTLSILMSAVVTGDYMIVTLTPAQRRRTQNLSCSRSICLSMPRYVVSAMTTENKKTLNDCLRNMDELSRKLRDELFVPVRRYHLTLLDVDIYPGLDGLPLETYDVIFKYLDERQLQILAKVNKQFFELLGSDNQFRSATSISIPTQDLPHIMSSFFEVEPYYQHA